jgi:hypothetical protein
VQASGGSWGAPVVSSSGRFVAFESRSSNLLANDTNNAHDIFLHDLVTAATSLVSQAPDGSAGNGDSTGPSSISGDGSLVVFASFATDLVPNDTNGMWDVFMRDRLRHKTTRVSVAEDGSQLAAGSGGVISPDGSAVAFETADTSLASRYGCQNAPDGSSSTQQKQRVYIRQLASSTTRLIGGCDAGAQWGWYVAAVSAKARTIAGAAVFDDSLGSDNHAFAIYRDGMRVTRAFEFSETWATSTTDDGLYVAVYNMDVSPGHPRAFIYNVRTHAIRAVWKA